MSRSRILMAAFFNDDKEMPLHISATAFYLSGDQNVIVATGMVSLEEDSSASGVFYTEKKPYLVN